jgi:hypothetical protein
VQKHGTDKASFYVGWIDPEGKRKCGSCGAGAIGKKTAKHLAEKTRTDRGKGPAEIVEAVHVGDDAFVDPEHGTA